MVMHWETWELRVDQHLNSIPGSFPNNHTTLNMSLVLSMPSFVFCEIGLSLFFFLVAFSAVKAPGYKVVAVPWN